MPTLWRITMPKYARTALSGHGFLIHASRWHRQGVPVVYLAESPALALLETMVHVESSSLLAFDYVALRIEAPDERIALPSPDELPADWNAWPWPRSTQDLGTHIMESGATPLLRVPSALVPNQFNYLPNPAHPDFSRLLVSPPEPFPIDPRLQQ